LSHYWPRPDVSREFPIERRVIETEPGVRVAVLSQRPNGEPRGEVILVHGLEGSADACYMRSLSAAVLRAGFASHRFNMRTCGGTEDLCDTLYHAGLTSDLLAVLREFRREGRRPAVLAGFSLGGNVVLKLAGELGDAAAGLIGGAAAVSTPLDLAACSRRIAEPDNRVYEARFVRRMRARLRATGRYSERDLEGLRSVLALDDRITAPSFGFGDAANYYRTQSSIGYLAGIRVPALLIQAQDDTFIPFSIYQSAAVRANPRIRLVVTDRGGHLGFLSRSPHRFWVDHAIMDWISGTVVNNQKLKSSGV